MIKPCKLNVSVFPLSKRARTFLRSLSKTERKKLIRNAKFRMPYWIINYFVTSIIRDGKIESRMTSSIREIKGHEQPITHARRKINERRHNAAHQAGW